MLKIAGGIVFILFGSIGLYSQTGTITGYLKNGEQPIEFGLVRIMGSNNSVLTDSSGQFTFENLSYGSYDIEVQVLGYEKASRKIILNSPRITLEFLLMETATELGETVISGTMKEVSKLESPVNVEVYSAKFFKANPTPSVFESLQNINGVRPQLNCNVCNTGDIHLNGLEGPYTMVLIDGMPIVSGLSTVYGLTGIPQSLIERVEIVKGPASTLYGSEAVGGLINIITKKPNEAPIFSIDAFGTSWGEINTDLGVKFSIHKKAHSLLGINYFNYSLPQDNNLDGFTDITLQNRISIFNKWQFDRKSKKIFTLAGRFISENRWGGEMEWKEEHRGTDSIYGESIYTNRWEFFGVYQFPTKEDIKFQFSANGHYQNSAYGQVIFNADQYVAFGQFTWNKMLGKKNDFLLGVTYRFTYYDDNTSATSTFDTIGIPVNMPSLTHLPGIFVQDEITFSSQQKLLLGIRYDYNSIHGSIFSPRANYKWTSKNKKNVLRIGAGNGYRVANVFTEDHAALTGARQVVFAEELKPETSWNGNINFVKKMFPGKDVYIGLDMTIWYTYFANRIIPDYETDPNKIIYSNLDGFSHSTGGSVNMEINWKSFTSTLGVTGMDVSIFKDGIRTQQLLTEQFTGVWNIGYNFEKIGVSIAYTGNIYGPMRLPLLGPLDDRPEYSPWFSIQNIQITKKFKFGLEIYGGVKNLLNYTPPSNSIARSFDPFDKEVVFDANGQVVATPDNPNALTFDPTYVFAPNQGIRFFLGVRYNLPTRR